ncbi:MAG: type 1 glutamine amidotransferase [Oligoflexia bacterium]|nr:type 1 glutamine amidotransferase [Oligoflexia bacterium]
MYKILLIDNTFDPPHGSPEISAQLFSAAKVLGMKISVTVVRAPDGGTVDEISSFDGVVLSGSKTRIEENADWIERELGLIRDCKKNKVPTFGICYGEQMIARAFGGQEAAKAAIHPEHGWAKIELREGSSSVILNNLSSSFYSYETHDDEVRQVPEGFVLVAGNTRCPIQAFESKEFPMWAVQFHPERDLVAGNKSLDDRLKKIPGFEAINRDVASEVYDANVGTTIFQNFLKEVKKWKK